MSQIASPIAPTAPAVAPVAEARPVRWGFLAAARIANKWATALHETGDAELVAVASRDHDKATTFAAQHGVAEVLDDYRTLVERDDLDIIYVASPHSHHLEHALLAIEAGKPVLVEKPATPSLHASQQLIKAAADRGVLLMEAMWTRCNPLVQQAADLVRRGVLGEPRLLQASFPVSFVAPDEHRIFNPALAGGAVLDLAVYPMHLAHALLGRPEGLSAIGTLTHTGVDNTSVASMRWPSQTIGTIATSLDGQGAQRLELVGTEAALLINDFVKPTEMHLRRHDGDEQRFVTTTPAGGYTYQAHEVHRCLRLGRTQSPIVPWQATLDVAAALDAWLADLHHPHAPTPGDRP